MTTAEVTVMGAGIFGLSVAYACAERGARVRVVDPCGLATGASGGPVGALAPHTPERWNAKKAFQFESLAMAETHWARVAELGGGAPGYARLGRLQPVADSRALALARERASAARTLWQGVAVWRVTDTRSCPGWAPQSPTGHVIHDTLSARLHPRRACEALARAIAALGGEITADDARPAGAVVWATGHAGLAALSRELGRPVGTGVKGQALLLRFPAEGLPQLFADALHIVPHDDGTVAVGSTSERDFVAPGTTDARLDEVHARAVTVCPALAGAEVVARWASVRPRARSRAPMLGAWPGRPGHYIANGGFKIGFGVAPKVGEVMADLVLDGRETIPAELRVEQSL